MTVQTVYDHVADFIADMNLANCLNYVLQMLPVSD